jgi:hypothetical protein
VGAPVGSAVAVAERVGRVVGEDAVGRVAVAIANTSFSPELEEQPTASTSGLARNAQMEVTVRILVSSLRTVMVPAARVRLFMIP